MTLIDCATLVNHAYKNQYAVVHINTNGANYDLVRAIVEVAQEEQSPVILAAYEANLDYLGYSYAARVLTYFAEQSDVPIAIHLDHGSTLEACQKAIDVGFTSVMIDGSKMSIDENLSLTQQVIKIAHPKGVSVEAEIGELQKLNPDGSMNDVKNLSTREDVVRMVNETDIDMLAVGIGNAHGFYKGAPDIRLDLLKELAAASTVPLVLHGSTGLSDDVIQTCISMGMAKVNLGTLIRTRCVEYTAEVIAEGQHMNHPWRVSRMVKDKIKENVRRYVRLMLSADKAGTLLT